MKYVTSAREHRYAIKPIDPLLLEHMILYLPEHFAEDRPEQLHALMRAYPLGALVMHTDAGLDANHIPFELLAEQGAHGML